MPNKKIYLLDGTLLMLMLILATLGSLVWALQSGLEIDDWKVDIFLWLFAIVVGRFSIELIKSFRPSFLPDYERFYITNWDILLFSVAALAFVLLVLCLRLIFTQLKTDSTLLNLLFFILAVGLLADFLVYGWHFFVNKLGTKHLRTKVNSDFEKRKKQTLLFLIRRLPIIWKQFLDYLLRR